MTPTIPVMAGIGKIGSQRTLGLYQGFRDNGHLRGLASFLFFGCPIELSETCKVSGAWYFHLSLHKVYRQDKSSTLKAFSG
jgi:hypothetical protein